MLLMGYSSPHSFVATLILNQALAVRRLTSISLLVLYGLIRLFAHKYPFDDQDSAKILRHAGRRTAPNKTSNTKLQFSFKT